MWTLSPRWSVPCWCSTGQILVLSAKEGVQSHTKLLFSALRRMAVPTLIFVNKIDRMGVAKSNRSLAAIRQQLTPDICVLHEVSGEGSKQAQVGEVVLQPDDALIEMLSCGR